MLTYTADYVHNGFLRNDSLPHATDPHTLATIAVGDFVHVAARPASSAYRMGQREYVSRVFGVHRDEFGLYLDLLNADGMLSQAFTFMHVITRLPECPDIVNDDWTREQYAALADEAARDYARVWRERRSEDAQRVLRANGYRHPAGVPMMDLTDAMLAEFVHVTMPDGERFTSAVVNLWIAEDNVTWWVFRPPVDASAETPAVLTVTLAEGALVERAPGGPVADASAYAGCLARVREEHWRGVCAARVRSQSQA